MNPSKPIGPGPVGHQGWFFLHPEAVPPRWRERASPAVFIPLLPEEAEGFLVGEPGVGTAERGDGALLRLIALGLPTAEIARRLNMSSRSVQRRVARLRQRYGAASKGELARLLTQWGFAGSPERSIDWPGASPGT